MDIKTNNQLGSSDSKGWTRSMEKEMLDYSAKFKIGSFNQQEKKPFFGIDTPPPYPSGKPWHLGAAAHYSKIDMIARTARMLGNKVLFPVGMDRNGLPVERYTEKKNNIRMRDTDRGKFLELCRSALDELESEMIEILKGMGFSADFDHIYRTDSPEYRAFTQATFIEQWKKGTVYIGKRPSNYCIDCGTTIADAEIEYKDIDTNLVYFKFDIKGSSDKITIASTRPELLGACQAILVNPDDDRYKKLAGKSAVVPLYGNEVPIIAHPYAKPEFGSGAVMICSYGDYSDAAIIRELNLGEKILIDTHGNMLESAGKELKGLKVKKARETIISLLKDKGLVEKIEPTSHRTPLCERSKTPIEIIPLEEYYINTSKFNDEISKLSRDIEFIPESHRQILDNWIKVAGDWPISRRRFYGTEIPVWYCKKCGEAYLPKPGRYYQPWKESPPEGAKCSKCGSMDFIGDERTFDTWMDSSVSALYVTKFESDDKFNKYTYPLTIRTQGTDIVRTWLYYSIYRCYLLTGRVPWSKVWIDGVGLDEHGEKMSKSKGNVIDPGPLLEKYTADAFRFWAASEGTPGSNFLFSEAKLAGAAKFLTKLWNVAKFIKSFGAPKNIIKYDELLPSDKLIIDLSNQLVAETLASYRKFDFFSASNKIREFVWDVFAPNYIELVKSRAYGEGFSEREKESAISALNLVLEKITLLLAPISPFLAESIWIGTGHSGSVHLVVFPKEETYNPDSIKIMSRIAEFNKEVWTKKKQDSLPLNSEIVFKIPEDLAEFRTDLCKMHKIKE